MIQMQPFALLILSFLQGCADDAASTAPLTGVTLVTRGGFTAPTDAVASPDGETFYFAALADSGSPALFEVSSQPGSDAHVLATSADLVHPSGLVLSCDGATLYVADGGDGATASLFAVDVGSGTLTRLSVTGIGTASGLAMGPDCATLHVTGRTPSDEPALFTLGVDATEAVVRYSGAPLADPGGVHVDAAGVAWAMDFAEDGTGVLFAIPADGSVATPVLDGLSLGRTGGVSLVSVGGTAVIPTLDDQGATQLTTVVIDTGELTQVPAAAIVEPGGIRTARDAAVLVVVDAGGDAIYRAE
jgi:hypothetical protein